MKLSVPPLIRLSLCLASTGLGARALAEPDRTFLEQHCYDCHDADNKKGGLDLAALKFDLNDPKAFAEWVKVHDRVRDGEMPPKKKPQPEPAERSRFLEQLAPPMIASDRDREAREGRSTWRRLNRYEYENTLRDLLHAPWLQIKEMLPEDGEAFRFNKVGDALDVSHVQMARYLAAADYALRQVMASELERPPTVTKRYYARQQSAIANKMKFSVFNMSPERATFPVMGIEAQPDVRAGKAPVTVGSADPEKRDLEGLGVVASSYEPIELRFNAFTAPRSGHYKLRFSGLSVWVGAMAGPKWWKPNLDEVSLGRRPEPVTIYSETPPRLLRRLGSFDVNPEPTINEIDTYLLGGESIRPDAARLFRSRPPNYRNPLAEKDGQPGVVFRWMEVKGPIYDEWPTAGHRLLFGDLPLKKSGKSVEVIPNDPVQDSERLLRGFIAQACRHPMADEEVARYLGVIQGALQTGSNFAEAMIAGYSAVLCSPAFVCLEQKPGPLDDFALAERLSYFVWNSAPDEVLHTVAARGELHRPEVLRAQTERLLADPKSQRFVEAFLDYWLDLRKVNATSPDAGLYPDYYLDDLLTESATDETRLFFTELLRNNLPSRNIVSSDFAFLNERLARHYGLWAATQAPEKQANQETAGQPAIVRVSLGETPAAPAPAATQPLIEGVTLRRVALPPDSPRGGLMTQASVLKVTANGTTTSPVVRGAWIMERVLGQPPPPPPPSVPAVEPDIRGASTIREQLDKHRHLETCAACHAKIDPAGFALENFDVFGGWRHNYRALGEGKPEAGIGKNGQAFAFHLALPVDASGVLPDGRSFQDIRNLKKLLLADEKMIARNLAKQFVVYATGASVRFGDRPELETILQHAQASQYGVRSLVLEVVQSPLFQNK